MNMQSDEYIAVFAGRTRASYLFQVLLRKGCNIELIPAPSKIAYGCCQAIRFTEEDVEIFLTEVKRKKLTPRGIYKIIKKGKYESYERVE